MEKAGRVILLGGLILCGGYLCFAALPDIITDPATRDVIEYLEAKSPSLKGTNTFEGVTTFSSSIVISTYSATANGFTYLPGAALIQWGTFSHAAADGTTGSVTYPKAFTTATGAVTVNAIHTTGGCFVTVSGISASGFSWRVGNPGNAGNCTSSNWMAVGY